MPFDQQQSSKTNSAIYFVTGAVAILLSYSIYSHLKIASNRSDQSIKRTIGRSERKLDDALQLKTLAYLMQSDNANIRHSSTKIILDRAISGI
ncbi:hypothetical protein BDF20DRAFT_822402 [Mycotypha africana]|uniref:uncharacterized protein n=1 Tax=Mycotypha africana TaxID=64632 RepID=UPI002300985A|nr:uncharacterized protein BDF20DRAFT_822402 [Mycotypha africana]KAI8975026.1 hypothetical protein BDF20DRAFT_822402 [Mycotypha africana]